MTVLRSALGCSRQSVGEEISSFGFAKINAAELSYNSTLQLGFWQLQSAARILPPDKQAPVGSRFRRYRKCVLIPWLDFIEPYPIDEWDETLCGGVSIYEQASAFNPLEKGQPRRFASMESDVLANAYVKEQIRFDLMNSAFSPAILARPIEVGIHLIKMVARPGVPSAASPNHVHLDGEWATWVHLLERTEVTGGRSYVTRRECKDLPIKAVNPEQILGSFILTQPGDAFGVRDDKVAHHVDPIEVVSGAAHGTRTILLVDFTPLVAVPYPPPTSS
jgi:hypothetical protein